MEFEQSLYPVRPIICEGIQDSLGFWIPRHGFPVLDSGILCPWNLDSWVQLLVEFRIPWAVFRIPKPRIPILQAKNFPHTRFRKRKVLDSGIRIPSYMGRIQFLAMPCGFSLRKHPFLLAYVKRGRERGNLGARERAREKGKEPSSLAPSMPFPFPFPFERLPRRSMLHNKHNKHTLFFFYKNIFYKNIEAEICEILRIF